VSGTLPHEASAAGSPGSRAAREGDGARERAAAVDAGRRPALLRALAGPDPVIAVELRPPRTGLGSADSMDAWIDLNHALRRFTASGRFVLLTDDAVGQAEEENLGHLAANLSGASEPGRLLPFLTCKHRLDYCLLYAERAAALGLEALVVLGGDPDAGAPRCVPHAYRLRGEIRARVPALALGGWANPHRDIEQQTAFLTAADFHGSFYLTQIVSHHSAGRLEALVSSAARRGCALPGLAGIFHYRSGNPATLARLGTYFPVPARELVREFEAGADPETITARSVRAALDAGARGVYVSNLGVRRPDRTLESILERV
jgi:5,10-methylenetetrahydrofolate reductase